MNYYKQYVVDIKQTLDGLPWESIQHIVHLLHQARMTDKQVFVMGNGGSASTASHMACDLNKNTVASNHPRFRVMALTDSMALFSACANDFSYEDVFAEQLENFVREGDIVVAISASGNSPNVLKAVKLARAHKAITIGWSGYDGGKLAGLVDFPVVIPSQSIEQIEDIHLMLEHMITVALRNKANAQAPINGDYIFGRQRVEAY
ncbi:SIS domain-containing protein [soil metagenome]